MHNGAKYISRANPAARSIYTTRRGMVSGLRITTRPSQQEDQENDLKKRGLPPIVPLITRYIDESIESDPIDPAYCPRN